MTQITIHIPQRLKPYITAKVKEGFESPESYLLNLVEAEQLHEAHAADVLETMTRKERARLNVVLLDRSKGPFESVDPFDQGYWDRLASECRELAGLTRKAHA